MARPRIGVWLIGAKGGVAVTTITGLIALGRGLTGSAGLVSELSQFQPLDLADWTDLVVGGHDVRDVSLADEAMRMHTESRAIDERLITQCKSELDAINARICSGTLINVGSTIEQIADREARERGESPRGAIERLQADFRAFVEAERLDSLIVVNVASTEPPVAMDRIPSSWSELDALIDQAEACPLPASSLYAIAALDLGYSYINFTPSLGSSLAAICELAERRGACHMGRDGKTGETLLKSTLAPMFAKRNLEIMSWVGHNIFGNMDGRVLDDPANKQTKVTSKDQLLGQILGYDPQTLVSIEYIKSLGDWKTAWDHIHFRGFLGAQMMLQFTWQGCDSLLAAPLVLDLVRFTERARRAGATGELDFLASFFKSPLGSDENDFGRQFAALEAWAQDLIS